MFLLMYAIMLAAWWAMHDIMVGHYGSYTW